MQSLANFPIAAVRGACSEQPVRAHFDRFCALHECPLSRERLKTVDSHMGFERGALAATIRTVWTCAKDERFVYCSRNLLYDSVLHK